MPTTKENLIAAASGPTSPKPVAYRELLDKLGGGYRYFDEHNGLPAGGLLERHEPLYDAPTTTAAAIWAAAMEQAAQLDECEHISETHPSNNGKIVKRIAEHIRAMKPPRGLT